MLNRRRMAKPQRPSARSHRMIVAAALEAGVAAEEGVRREVDRGGGREDRPPGARGAGYLQCCERCCMTYIRVARPRLSRHWRSGFRIYLAERRIINILAS